MSIVVNFLGIIAFSFRYFFFVYIIQRTKACNNNRKRFSSTMRSNGIGEVSNRLSITFSDQFNGFLLILVRKSSYCYSTRLSVALFGQKKMSLINRMQKKMLLFGPLINR